VRSLGRFVLAEHLFPEVFSRQATNAIRKFFAGIQGNELTAHAVIGNEMHVVTVTFSSLGLKDPAFTAQSNILLPSGRQNN
jgi:hypothetical protein